MQLIQPEAGSPRLGKRYGSMIDQTAGARVCSNVMFNHLISQAEGCELLPMRMRSSIQGAATNQKSPR